VIVLQIEVADFTLLDLKGQPPIAADRNTPCPGAVAPELVNAPARRRDHAAHIGCCEQHPRLLRSRRTTSLRSSRLSSSSMRRNRPRCRTLRMIMCHGVYAYTVRPGEARLPIRVRVIPRGMLSRREPNHEAVFIGPCLC